MANIERSVVSLGKGDIYLKNAATNGWETIGDFVSAELAIELSGVEYRGGRVFLVDKVVNQGTAKMSVSNLRLDTGNFRRLWGIKHRGSSYEYPTNDDTSIVAESWVINDSFAPVTSEIKFVAKLTDSAPDAPEYLVVEAPKAKVFGLTLPFSKDNFIEHNAEFDFYGDADNPEAPIVTMKKIEKVTPSSLSSALIDIFDVNTAVTNDIYEDIYISFKADDPAGSPAYYNPLDSNDINVYVTTLDITKDADGNDAAIPGTIGDVNYLNQLVLHHFNSDDINAINITGKDFGGLAAGETADLGVKFIDTLTAYDGTTSLTEGTDYTFDSSTGILTAVTAITDLKVDIAVKKRVTLKYSDGLRLKYGAKYYVAVAIADEFGNLPSDTAADTVAVKATA